MRYSPRRIDRWQCDRVSGSCTDALALQVVPYLLPALVCHPLFSIAEHRHPAHQVLSNNTSHRNHILLPMSLSTHLQNTWVIRYGQHVAHFVATRVGAWARHIIVGAVAEVIEEAHQVVVIRTIRCAAFNFFFCGTDIPQSERGVCAFPGRVSSRHHRKRPLLRARCICVCHLDRGRGRPLQPGNPLAGKSSESYTFFQLECSLTTCHIARRFGSPQLASLGGGGSGSGVLPQRQQQR